jgi:uncharacterized protein YehS (DUF1456 family)
MKNNDILRRLRYVFDFNDSKMIAIFRHADLSVNREQVSAWLKKDDAEDFLNCNDLTLASFLNGLIVERRGQREGSLPEAEKKLDNNIILKKLKIALAFQAEDVLRVLSLAGFRLSKHELSAFFRKADHKHYRQCKDQVIRNFLQGLQQELRPQPQAGQRDSVDMVKPKAYHWPRS